MLNNVDLETRIRKYFSSKAQKSFNKKSKIEYALSVGKRKMQI